MSEPNPYAPPEQANPFADPPLTAQVGNERGIYIWLKGVNPDFLADLPAWPRYEY